MTNKNYMPYIAGVMLGDGCFVNNKRLVLGSKDIEFIEAFKKAIIGWRGYCFTSILEVPPKKVTIRGKEYQFKKLYFFQPAFSKAHYQEIYSFTKQYEENITKATLEDKYNFIKGLFDSEGSISQLTSGSKNHAQITFSNKNKELTYFTMFILQNIGLHPSIYFNIKRGEYYIYVHRKMDVAIFMEKIGFTIERKNNKYKDIINAKI